MNSISSFRGLSGEVVCGFVRPGTFLTAIPVLVVWLVVAALIGFTPLQRAFPLNFFITLAASAFLVARFAIPAARGHLDAMFFGAGLQPGESLGFVARYAILTVAWGVPASLLAWALAGPLMGALAQAGSPGMLLQGGLVGLVLLVLALVYMVAPSLCYIIATATSDVSEVMSLAPWRWLLFDRRGDLVAFYATLFGGVAAFALVYLVPVSLVISIAFKISAGLGAAAATFVVLMPVAISPILIGRLCGAFVAGEGTFEPDAGRDEVNPLGRGEPVAAGATAAARAPIETAGTTPPAPATGPSPAPAGVAAPARPKPPPPVVRPGPVGEGLVVKPTLEKIARKVDRVDEQGLTAAVEQAEGFIRAHPGDPHAAVELALLYRRTGRTEEALGLAGVAIRRLVDTGAAPMASKVFKIFGADRFKIRFDAKYLERFGQMLLKMQHFTDAGWCLYGACRGGGGDAVAAQRKLFEVAEAASAAGHGADATSLYRFLLRHHPDSELASHAQAALGPDAGRLRAAG